MDHQALKELAQVQGPAVSILCPLETRRAGNEHDSLVLRELRDRAVKEVEASLHERGAASLIERIDDALGSIDLQHPTEGVAILVSPTVSRVIALDTYVEPKVVIGERFAIRDLISASSRSPRARIIVLSQAKSRCVDLTGTEIVERVDSGFPVDIEPPTEADTPHRDFPLDEHEHAEAAKFVFRAVDHALAALEHADPRPVVLVGEERDLAYFGEVTHLRERVIGRVHGNHQRGTPDEIARLVRPVLEEHQLRRQIDASDEVREAIDSRAVCGIADTWLAALAGRGHRLVVEDGYRFPALVVDGVLEAAPADHDAFDAVARTVEEVIRRDGDVVAVPAGSLEDLEHIALLIRF
jgi:hypothetical protein